MLRRSITGVLRQIERVEPLSQQLTRDATELVAELWHAR